MASLTDPTVAAAEPGPERPRRRSWSDPVLEHTEAEPVVKNASSQELATRSGLLTFLGTGAEVVRQALHRFWIHGTFGGLEASRHSSVCYLGVSVQSTQEHLQRITRFLDASEVAALVLASRNCNQDQAWHQLCLRDIPRASGEASWRLCFQHHFEEGLLVLSPRGDDSLPIVNVVLLGDALGGKSTLLYRIAERKFAEALPMTHGACYRSVRVLFRGHRLNVRVWDMPGHRSLKYVGRMYLSTAHAAVVCWDLANREALGQVQGHIDEARRARPGMSLTLAGLKADLVEDAIEQDGPPVDQARALAEQASAIFVPVSAKTGSKLEELLAATLRDVDFQQLEQAAERRSRVRALGRAGCGLQ